MIKERRQWVAEYRRDHQNKIPDDLEGFHERFNVVQPLTPEEQAAKDAEEEAEAGKKGAKKKPAAGGKKKKKKKKGDKDDGKPGVIKLGPTETVRHFETFYQTYNETWATRDEAENYKQEYDTDLAKLEMEPVLRKKY